MKIDALGPQTIINKDMTLFGTKEYLLKTLDNMECGLDVRAQFEKYLKKKISCESTLETYQNFISNDDDQMKIHYELSQFLKNSCTKLLTINYFILLQKLLSLNNKI